MPPTFEIDGLRVGALIGAGSWADVHEGIRIDSGETVAVKVLRPRVVEDETSIARMMQEARLCWLLDHPNVVRVHEWGLHPSRRVYLVMERLHGETCDERIRRVGPMTPRATLDVARGITLGLLAIHQRAVHRDIKPSNVFLCREYTDHRAVKILDLGIAALPTNDPERLVHTAQGEVVGTPSYSPPERFRGAPADVRTDLYALGAVLYECLAGVPAYSGHAMHVAVQVCRATQPPTLDRDDVPDGLRTLIARLMDPRADARPESAEEVLAALDALEERVDIERWAARHSTRSGEPAAVAPTAESFLAAVLRTVLQHFHADHVPREIRVAVDEISRLSDQLERAQAARDEAQEAATRIGRALHSQADELGARLRSANTAVTAQRALLDDAATRLRTLRGELDDIDGTFAMRCDAFESFTRDALERARTLAEPVETGGQQGRQVQERLAELDGLAARRAHLARVERRTRDEVEAARRGLAERMAEAGALRRALTAVEVEKASTLFLREGEARAQAEEAERLHLDRQHARQSIGLLMHRMLFAD
ncbi:protein kinase [Myxococcota bacterium]|nr:protein kinase [Myxococcota bacterium]